MLTTGLSALVRRSAPCLLLASALAAPVAAQGTFLAQDGLLVVELESAEPIGDWTLSTSTPGFINDGYFRWDGPNLFNSPGASGIFGFEFEVETAGNWILSLRNRHEDPDPTEDNDVWIRMDGGQWIKVFSNMPGSVGAWTWESRFDFGSNQPQANYDLQPGTHLMEFSGRSNGFKMDRFHIYLPGHPGGNDPNRPESPRRFGDSYCGTSVNSTGSTSTIDAYGSPLVSANNALLICTDLPQNVLGYFLVSNTQGFVANPAGSDGNLCIGGDIGRFPLSSGSAGFASIRLDLGTMPQSSGAVAVQPGEEWNFQFWHRDTGSQGITSNFSRGLAVTFQ